MDFKSLITKISSMDDKIETVAAPELPKAVQLNEDAQLRVLAGQTTFVAEAKKAKEEKMDEVFDADAKPGDKKNTAKGVATKTKTGLVHKSTSAYGGSEEKADDSDEDDKPKKKAKKESIDTQAFRGKFAKMVEAKKESKKPDADGDGVPDWADKKPGKDDNAEKKASGKKGMSAKQAKYFGKKNESKMMPKGKKRPVKESVEQKLTFKDMIKLVQESGGQQQIDPLDKELFAWAQRVASNKFTESTKAEIYAGLVYERMGGVFEMYDVLAEAK